MEDDDLLEPDQQELMVKLPPDWDASDVAALLRRSADELDALGQVQLDRISLVWVKHEEEMIPMFLLAYRRHKRPPRSAGICRINGDPGP